MQAQNGLWLPRQFLIPLGGNDGLSLPLIATYRRVIAGNEGGLMANAVVPSLILQVRKQQH